MWRTLSRVAETADAPPPVAPVAHPKALNVRYTPNPDGWVTAQFVEWPAAISQGRDESEAFRNLLAAAYDVVHVPTGPQRVAVTIQARVIEPLFTLLRR
jgi:hypothetical protein